MGIIYISQRVDINNEYIERRDALDQKWIDFFMEEEHVIIPVSNHIENVLRMLKIIPPNYIILSGGNTPVLYGGDAPERDEVDRYLINYSVDNEIPLLGVCRGMQSINLYYGGTLKNIKKHVAVTHSLFSPKGEFMGRVNSYHNYACDIVPEILEVVSTDENNVVEAIKSKSSKIYGIMWHPERSDRSYEYEVSFLRKIFRNS